MVQHMVENKHEINLIATLCSIQQQSLTLLTFLRIFSFAKFSAVPLKMFSKPDRKKLNV